jgi:small GTP-binding protein
MQRCGDAKIVLLGASSVGKTSIIKTYLTGHIDPVHRPTISAAFHQQTAVFEGKSFQFGIWDTSGDEQYRSIAPIYFRGAHVAYVVADASTPSSDDDAIYWANELVSRADEPIVIIIVMNKIDLVDDLFAVEKRARAIAASYGDHYHLTSALKGTGVNELFLISFDFVADVIRALDVDHPQGRNSFVGDEIYAQKKGFCC